MLRHRWNGNKCVKCGLIRKMGTRKRFLIELGNRKVHDYKRRVCYLKADRWDFERPDCREIIVEQLVENYYKSI